MKRKRYKIKEDTCIKRISDNIVPKKDINKGIIVNFSYPFSLYSCSIKKIFTNYLKDEEECLKTYKHLFTKVLKYFSEHDFDELAKSSKSTHVHMIKNDDKIRIIEKIVGELIIEQQGNNYNNQCKIDNYVADSDLWQIAYPEGLRLIGTRDANILNLLFIDYHHLLFASKSYNNIDYYNYKYDLMTMSKNIVAQEQVAATNGET